MDQEAAHVDGSGGRRGAHVGSVGVLGDGVEVEWSWWQDIGNDAGSKRQYTIHVWDSHGEKLLCVWPVQLIWEVVDGRVKMSRLGLSGDIYIRGALR